MINELITVEKAMQGNSFQLVDGMLTVAEGMKIAKAHKVTTLIINQRNENDEYGMVLLADIAKHVIAKDRSPERTNLYEIMEKPVLSVLPSMDVRYCARLFERFGIHTAPVIADGVVLGMVDYTDIVLAKVSD